MSPSTHVVDRWMSPVTTACSQAGEDFRRASIAKRFSDSAFAGMINLAPSAKNSMRLTQNSWIDH